MGWIWDHGYDALMFALTVAFLVVQGQIAFRSQRPPGTRTAVADFVPPLLRTANVVMGLASLGASIWMWSRSGPDAGLPPWTTLLCAVGSAWAEVADHRLAVRATEGEPHERFAHDARTSDRLIVPSSTAIGFCSLGVLSVGDQDAPVGIAVMAMLPLGAIGVALWAHLGTPRFRRTLWAQPGPASS